MTKPFKITGPRKPKPAKRAKGQWIRCKSRLPLCPRGKDALGTEVLIWPRDDYPSAFYGRRATGKPTFYRHGVELYRVTHWMPLPTGPKERSAP